MRLSFMTAAAVSNILIHSTQARDCTFIHSLTIFRTPEQFSNMLNCDIFPTTVHISSTFPGTFSLPDIVDITGSISIYNEFGPSTITSIKADDLKYLGSLDLDQKSWNVDFVSMAKLEAVGDVTISVNNKSGIIFPELRSVGLLSLKGNVSATDFSSLRNASQIIIQQSIPQNWDTTILMPALNVTFPALQSCGKVYMSGNFSEVSIPKLVRSKNINQSVSIDIETVHNINGTSVPINFDFLTNATDINITGSSISLHMPVFASANSISVAADGDIDSPALTSASAIHMQGRISSVSLPNLKHLNQSLSLQTDLPFDCMSLQDVFDRTSELFAEQYGCKSAAYEGRKFECRSSVIDDGKNGVSRGLKYKLGFGLGLGGGVAVLGLSLVLRLCMKRKGERKLREAKAVMLKVRGGKNDEVVVSGKLEDVSDIRGNDPAN